MVYSGTDLRSECPVAIKVLLPEMAMTANSRRRFVQEIRVLRHLRSDHVVRVLDEGALESGEPFMVMEQLRGRTLKDVLRSAGSLRVSDAVDYVLEACEVLAEAHVAGVVHRDIKPENLFLVEGEDAPRVKVLDFGISKAPGEGLARDAKEPSITRGGEVMGSPYYMAPEQMLSSSHVDRSADIWSVGVVLYELLTGRLPFVGENAMQVRAHVMMSTPLSMRQVRADVPVELERIVMRCLEKVSDQRYKGLAVLAASLAPFGSERAKLSAHRILQLGPSQAPPPLPPVASPLPARPVRNRPVPSFPAQIHHAPIVASRAGGSVEFLAHRSHRMQRTMLMGVGAVFFALGLAIGVVISVWQHQDDTLGAPALLAGGANCASDQAPSR
jgi:serine/threonine-protein kinase